MHCNLYLIVNPKDVEETYKDLTNLTFEQKIEAYCDDFLIDSGCINAGQSRFGGGWGDYAEIIYFKEIHPDGMIKRPACKSIQIDEEVYDKLLSLYEPFGLTEFNCAESNLFLCDAIDESWLPFIMENKNAMMMCGSVIDVDYDVINRKNTIGKWLVSVDYHI